MKKNLLTNILAATVALFTALFALPQTAQAKITYDLEVAGVPVNSANCNDLAIIPGVSGKVKYDPATKTLILDNATINSYGSMGISSRIDGLTVKLSGGNKIMGTGNNFVIWHTRPMTITGGGTLNVECKESSCIFIDETSLTIDSCIVNAKGYRGFMGRNNNLERLTIRNATVRVKGEQGFSRDIKSLSLVDCFIASPAGAKWDSFYKTVCDASGNVIKTEVAIHPVSKYNLWIAGTQVNSANCNDLTVIDGVSGKVKYDPHTSTLTLENAHIAGEESGIISKIYGFTVKLIDYNSVDANTSIWTTKPMTITGSGMLNIGIHYNKYGILVDNTSLTIDGCTIDASCKNSIAGKEGSESITIRNATVKAEGTELGSIRNFKTFTLEGCKIASPDGAAWNAEQKAVCDGSGKIVKSRVKIAPGYGLKIAGTWVNEANCNDLSKIPGVSGGTVKYDPATNTLTLDNATINVSGDEYGIISEFYGLTVRLIGTNTVTTTRISVSAVCHAKPMTLTGGGTLNAQSTSYGIIAERTSLTIDGCTVNVNSKGESGITGDGYIASLTIRNAMVTAEGRYGSIADFKTLTLEGCKIISPDGAVWNAGKKTVCDAAGNKITGPVTIEPTTYALSIAGTQVTPANRNNLSVIDGVSGTVKYDPATKTLTLDNATINSGGSVGISSYIDGLTVRLTGANTVKANNTAVRHDRPMTLTGGGTLDTESKDCGIYAYQTSLTIDGCTVSAKGIYGIAGYDASSETLTIRNATVTAEGTKASIADFKTLTLEDCAITQPAGAAWNATAKAVCDASGNVITDKVTIRPITYYNLWIADTKVNEVNCNDLSVINGVSGTVKYDPATKTLTLDNATINDSASDGIYSKIDGLTVKITGTNTITNLNKYPAIFHNKPMTLTGGGTLNAWSQNHYGIFASETSLTIDGCTVNAKGIYGIAGHNASSETLTIRKATVTAQGNSGSIRDFKTLTLNGCAITSPDGAVWNPGKKAVCDAAGNKITGPVTIEPTEYDLRIAGTQVTLANRNNLSVIPGVSGTVKYDPATNTLTLDNATINGGKQHGIYSDIDGLTVKLTGTNTVKATSEGYAALSHARPMTLTGGGTLNTEGTNGNGIYAYKTSLTIDGCTVNAKGEYGIAGNTGSSETLTIRNATVTAEGSSGSIRYFKTLTLEGCKIASPAGAVWNPGGGAVCDAAGNIITGKVTITPGATAIEAVTADVPARKRGVYNLQGVRLGDSPDRLPAGVYIYNGKKIIKK